MIRFRTLPLCLLLALPASAQTADEIIARNIEARGGAGRLKAVQTVRYTARVPRGLQPTSVMDETVASRNITVMILELKRPNLSRSTMLLPGFSQLQYEQALHNNMTPEQLQSLAAKATEKQLLALAATGDYSWGGTSQVAGFDGKAAWMWNSQQRKVMKRNRPTGDEAPGFGLDGRLMDYRDRGYRAELAGRAKAEGKDCFKLKLTSKDGEVTTYYIDTTSFLEVVVEGKPKSSPMNIRKAYRDWKAVDGIMVAHTVVQTTSGIGNQLMTIDKVEFNVPD